MMDNKSNDQLRSAKLSNEGSMVLPDYNLYAFTRE
jgi:hypothetical protein